MGRRLLFYAAAKKRTAGEGTPRGPHAAPFENGGARHKKEAAECAVSPLQNGTTKQTAPQSAAIPRGPAGKQTARACQAAWQYPPLRALCSPVRRTFYGCAFSASDIAHPSTSNSKFLRVYLINQTCQAEKGFAKKQRMLIFSRMRQCRGFFRYILIIAYPTPLRKLAAAAKKWPPPA